MMQVILDSAIRLPEAGMPPRLHASLHEALSFPNPEFIARRRMGRWTGATPKTIEFIDRDTEGRWVLPRGAIDVLLNASASAGVTISFDDRRARREALELRYSFTLRDYQEQAVIALVHHTQGMVVLPCGAGKTVVGVAAIARCQQPALVLVHTHDLLEQWCEALRTGMALEPGVIANEQRSLSDVTVATVQTLAHLSANELADVGAHFGTVVVDECHHVPAATFRQVISAMPALYRFGLTATPERSDGLTPMLRFTLGDSVFAIDHQRLIDAGHLLAPQIEAVHTGVTVPADTYNELVSRLVRHPERNAQLVTLATESTFGNKASLVLSGRVEHCEWLAAALCDDGVAVAALTSHRSKSERSALLSAFRNGELAVLCATSLADEGLDIARLERLILATPARAEGRTIQRLGRLMRPHPGKGTPILYDLVDDHPMASRQYVARQRAYQQVLASSAREPANDASQTPEAA